MRAHLSIHDQEYTADLLAGTDISLSFGPGGDNPNAFHITEAEVSPIVVGDFTGSVAKGSGANCDIIRFCAHGNTTHTECLGHITKNHESVGELLRTDFLTADLITVTLSSQGPDHFIGTESLRALPEKTAEAIILRSLPNDVNKKTRKWSGENPPFIAPEAMAMLVSKGYTHLLTDFPSVDPEEDDGALTAHHIWWQVPEAPRYSASITELIYVPDELPDGLYLLNLQFPKIMSDASPSRPVIFPLNRVK